MSRKRACMIINPHAGQNVVKIADLIAVLSAAGWKTEIALKEFGGQVVIPSSYDGALFEHPMAEEEPSDASQQQRTEDKTQQYDRDVQEGQQEPPELVGRLLEHGYKVTVGGATSQPGKQPRYIIAGTIPHQMAGDTTPVAIRVNESATVLRRSGKQVSPRMVQELQEGAVIVAVGKKSKYGVIRATHLVLPWSQQDQSHGEE